MSDLPALSVTPRCKMENVFVKVPLIAAALAGSLAPAKRTATIANGLLPFDTMKFSLSNTTDTSDAVVSVEQEKPRQPRWPIFVIAFAGGVTLLWISWLFWLLSRILFFVFYD